MLSDYLSQGSASLLSQTFIEIEEPLTTNITMQVDLKPQSVISLAFEDISVDRWEKILSMLQSALAGLAQNALDVDRMRDLAQRSILKNLESLEQEPHDTLHEAVIQNFLYGKNDNSKFEAYLRENKHFEMMKSWSSSQWSQIVTCWLLENSYEAIVAKPSASLSQKLVSQDKHTSQLRKSLIEGGQTNEVKHFFSSTPEIADEAVLRTMVNKFTTLNQYDMAASNLMEFEKSQSKFFLRCDQNVIVQTSLSSTMESAISKFHFSQIDSDFMTIGLYSDASLVSPHSLKYLPLYCELLYNLPIHYPDGRVISNREAVMAFEIVTLDSDTLLGISGSCETFYTGMKFKTSLYTEATTRFFDFLQLPVFSPERVSNVLTKKISELPSLKRDGSSLVWSVSRSLYLDKERSPAYASNIIAQAEYLYEIQELLDENPEQVTATLRSLHNVLLRSIFAIHIIGDLPQVPHLMNPWTEAAIFLHDAPKNLRGKHGRDMLTSLGPEGTAVAVPLESADSMHAVCSSKAIQSYEHSDLPALITIIAYLNSMEGLFWRQIRGDGLAYDGSLSLDLDLGNYPI